MLLGLPSNLPSCPSLLDESHTAVHDDIKVRDAFYSTDFALGFHDM